MSRKNKPNFEPLNEWNNNPDNWKWGIFYFNKNDKRIFPPKRSRMLGWTINFANPLSVLVFIAAIVLAIMASKYLNHR